MAPAKVGRKTKDRTKEFFGSLAERGEEGLLKRVSGTLRFDLTDGGRIEHWFVTMKKGDVSVSHKDAKADAVARMDKELFDRMVRGRANAMAAMLRGVLVPEGELGLLMVFQRLFPGPPRSAAESRRARMGKKAS